ncbi:glycosyltransferase family 4 protein [Brevibacillus sp. SYP-B805]|uniref:glycosyltransferase family protein n=1 Tax=Brevibacillus sp. SYP-B805 TaxID=1578199 RepID=UPI0013EAB2BA|nr:glycosyltransferase family 4 protein [Brevibacillus sp. SYP-B805]
MRIFHGIVEIAGQMGILSGAFKRKGYLSVGYNIFHTYLGYQEHLINTVWTEIQNTHRHILNFFDLFHFHYASSILPNYADLPLLKERGKKMIMHFWGNDVRFHGQARINNPYVYTGDSPPDEVIHARLAEVSRYLDEAIVQDYEVYAYVAPFFKKVHVVPIAIDLNRFDPHYPSVAQSCPLILHAPTNPEFKGTAIVESVLAQLQRTHSFRYRRIEGMNHEEATKLYREADLIIDQVRCGSYGLLSVESMALGKPVVCYIRSDLVGTFPPGLPIVNANPDTLYEQVKMLLEQPELRHQLGMAGRRYVENVHASDLVAAKLLQIYQEMQA